MLVDEYNLTMGTRTITENVNGLWGKPITQRLNDISIREISGLTSVG
jgi:hypothetical protein